VEEARTTRHGGGRPSETPPIDRRSILDRIRTAVERADSRDDQLRAAVRLLSEAVPKYTWTGIYLVEGETLVLHNHIGLPTPHATIGMDSGICGLAARQGRTVVVPDVGSDPRYLACSPATRSEMVVPILKEGEVVGEIDIDSDLPDAFDEEDRRLLEDAARLLGAII